MVIKKTLASIFLLSLALLILTAECAPYDLSPFHSKEEKIAMWKELWDAHSNTEYKSVGKTSNGKDIWLFSVGNPAGGRVLWDGEMHGGEDKGSEILYLMAKWLLESGDQRATEILEENYVLFIPVVNDRNERGNGNVEVSPHGVDLNRNFETGWSYTPPGDDEWCYSGAYPVSEPETKTLRSVFSSYKPFFYVNMHCGAGPYAAYYSGSNKTLSEQAILKTKEVCNEMAVVPYPTRVFGSRGFAIGDAVALGIQSAWLIECVGAETAGLHLPEHYEELVTVFFPKCQALFIAMCEISASYNPLPPTPEPSSTPYVSPAPTPTAILPPTPTPMPVLTPTSTPTPPLEQLESSDSPASYDTATLPFLFTPSLADYPLSLASVFFAVLLIALDKKNQKGLKK